MFCQRRKPLLALTSAAVGLALLAACEEHPTPAASEHALYAHGISKPPSAELNRQLAALRQATAPFHNVRHAEAAGYDFDEPITSCWYHSGLGGQGYHHGNRGLIDGTVSLLEPELLMYEPNPAGQLRLVGVEYIVPIDAWTGRDRPTLLGERFHRNDELGLYVLHVWLWRHNPRGIFADWNPMVSCEHAEESEDRSGA